jgi:hypothetical protein
VSSNPRRLLADFDVDGNGVVDRLTDTLLALRHAFGFRGATLIAGAVGAGARGPMRRRSRPTWPVRCEHGANEPRPLGSQHRREQERDAAEQPPRERPLGEILGRDPVRPRQIALEPSAS